MQRAVEFAGYNRAVQNNSQPVVIEPEDVTFPQTDVIRVVTHRTAATGDPLRTYFLRVVNPFRANTADVTASAMAQAFDVCGTPCLKPWCIPDRWQDANGNDTYDAGEVYDPNVTGYKAPADVGLAVTLKVGNSQSSVARSIFYPVDYPPRNYPGQNPLTGGSTYRDWIAECCPYLAGPGDQLQLEPGNKTGPTVSGVAELIAQDRGAYWDAGSGKVRGSAFTRSPRVALVPFFDPTLPPKSGRNWVTVTKVGAFFIEGLVGNEVRGRFIDAMTPGAPCPGGGLNNNGAFLRGIALIQ